MAVEFRILGSVEVSVNGVVVPVGPAQQQCVLAALLADVNQIVLVDQLMDRVWGARVPDGARNSLRSYLSRLRRIADVRIEHRSRGYVLLAEASSVDMHLFRLLVTAARDAADEDRALALFEQALGMWRGEPLSGLDTPWADILRAALKAERIAVDLDHTDLRMRRGEHHALLAGLAPLTVDHPLDERLAGQLMLALYRCGRQAEALAHYEGLRGRLADELGIDPAPELQELHRRILCANADLRVVKGPSPRPGLPVPQQLPAAVTNFTGRVGALKELDEALPRHPAVVISAIAGTAGVGKTALAVEWAHRVAARFPDGQLYVNLRGYGPGTPIHPLEAITRFLRSLDLAPEQIPVDLDEAAALFRTMLAGRKVLILLDNAATPDQVRPLLPGTVGCLVLVTSRHRLDGLVAYDGARRLTVDVFTEEEADQLLARVLGAERVGRERPAVAELVRLTARLPLALRITAAKLARHPGSLADYVVRLRSGDQLGDLEIQGDERAALRSTFGLSYRALPTDQRRLFRLLGLFPGEDFASDAVAALAGITTGQAATLLDDLAAAHLIDQHRPARYTFHDLLRSYAGERGRIEDGEQDRVTALGRLFDCYLRTADAAAKVIHPQLLRLPQPPSSRIPTGFFHRAEALAWLDGERANLVAVGVLAAEQGPRSVAWRLADTLRGYFWIGWHHPDWSALAAAALTAAEAEGDSPALAAAQLNFGDLFLRRNQQRQAVEHYTRAAGLLRLAGWVDGQAAVFGKLGLVYRESGDATKAADCYQRALALAAQTRSPVREAGALGNLGFVQYDVGNYEQATAGHAKAMALYEKLGIVSGQATAMGNLGDALHALGRFDEALTEFDRALPHFREIGDVSNESATLRSMAAVDRDTGRHERAVKRTHLALELARRAGDPRVEADALNTLGTIHQRLGRSTEAIHCHRKALDLARRTGIRYNTVEALIELAVAREDPDDLQQALSLARTAGYRGLEGHSLTALTRLLLSRGETEQAAEHGEQALKIHRETGHRLGEARTLAELADVFEVTEGVEAARPWRERARYAFTTLGVPSCGGFDG
jgi:DNA-binding SARP family transcriptional activator/tetratricopeptide (TPR) repeat protein